MKKNIYVSVSTLPVKEYQKIVDYASFLQDKADFLHCDVMDGKFVENKTYDWNLVEAINKNSLLMLDVHLMIENPQDFVDQYIDAGANILTFHYEAIKDKKLLSQVVKYVKSRGTLVGLAVCPGTPLKEFKYELYDVDVVLVMCVEPGAYGQKFMASQLDKVKEIDTYRNENNLNFKIEADGGVNDITAKQLINAGADILVSGNYVYQSSDKAKAIKDLKTL